MIAHVAEAGEGRGRVVLRLGAGRPSRAAIEAAIIVAQAWNSEIESLAIEDPNLIHGAAFPFARELAVSGRVSRAIDTHTIVRELRHALRAGQRQVETMARAAGVPLHCRMVREEPVRALAEACASNGPWNVVALAEPFGGHSAAMLRAVLDGVGDATALVVVGPQARRRLGRVVVAVEASDHLDALVRTADRIAAVLETGIALVLIGDDEEDRQRLEGEVRLALVERADILIHATRPMLGDGAVGAELIRRTQAAFLIARFGGRVVPSDGSLQPLAAALECPLLLVR